MSVRGPEMMTNGWRFNQTHRWLNEHEGRQWKINALYARAESLLRVVSCLCCWRTAPSDGNTARYLDTVCVIMKGFYGITETHYAQAQREKQYSTIY